MEIGKPDGRDENWELETNKLVPKHVRKSKTKSKGGLKG
jgi:hypothetical protein